MRLWLNNFLLGDEANRVYLDEPVEGLELPGRRTSRGTRSGQDGSYIGAQFNDARFITITGHIWSASIPEAMQKRRDIQYRLPLYPKTITLRVSMDDGKTYEMNAVCVDFKMPINRQRFRHEFKINLECQSPNIYDTSAGSQLSATIRKAIPGGFQFTSTTPQFDTTFFFTESQSNSVVTNTSPNTTYPTITITGRISDPVLVNRATGETFSLVGYTVTSSTDVTIIDMQNHTVTLNGGNAFGYVPLNAVWWGLLPGDNTIDFTSGSGSDVTTADMTFRPVYLGI